MKKKSKWERSQEAHVRLMNLNRHKADFYSGKPKGRYLDMLGNYHADCIGIQNTKNRVLTKSERKSLFKSWKELYKK